MLVAFNVVAFALVEIPLLAYLLAPKPTAKAVTDAARVDPIASAP